MRARTSSLSARARASLSARAQEEDSLVFPAGGAGGRHRVAEFLRVVLVQARVPGGAKDLVEVERAVSSSVLEIHAVTSNHCHLEVMANLCDDVLVNNLTTKNIRAFHRLVSIIVALLVIFRITFSSFFCCCLLLLYSRVSFGLVFFSSWRRCFVVFQNVTNMSLCFLSTCLL